MYTHAPRAARLAQALLARSLLMGTTWWAIAEGEVHGWLLSGIAVLLAAAVSLVVVPAGSFWWHVPGLARFVPYFLAQSVRGGVDVAARALHPRMPIRPGTILYRLRLPEGPSRAFFVVALSLLPGTLSARLEGQVLRVHLLHRGVPAEEKLAELEVRVAALFGVQI